MSGISSGESLHFVLEGNDSIADELATGHYDYTVVFTADRGRRYGDAHGVGGTEIVNLSDNDVGTSEYGAGWWIDGVDRLVPGDGTASSQPYAPPDADNPLPPEEEGLPDR